MPLPGARVALAASLQTELLASNSLIGLPLPPLRSRPRAEGEPLHIVYLMPRTGVGGGARVLLEHANHLEELGARVTVISHHPRPDWFELRAEFVCVPFGQRLDRSIPACDLIVAGYWSQILLARHLGIAPVVHFEQGDFHLYDEVGDGMRGLVEACVRSADWTITVGDAARRALDERYGVNAVCIPNAVDNAVFFPGDKPERRRVMFVGWDGTRFKGIDLARKIAAGLAGSHPGVDIVWVTPGRPVGEDMGQVVIAPTQPELARHYREAAVYVATSRYESFPLPPLEAMASGTPVVSSANAGVRSYALENENCLLAPVENVEGLLAATRRVLDDPELAAHLRRGGLKAAAAYSWPTIMGGLLARYQSLVAALPVQEAAPQWELDLGGLAFSEEGDEEVFWERLAHCQYREVAIPVSQVVLDEYRLVRWKVVAHREEGWPGAAYFHLPAVSAEPVEDSLYQFGIDMLREGLADEAFSWFATQSRQAVADEQVVIGRWVVLALIASGRREEAQALAETFATEYPAHVDYYLLAAHAAGSGLRATERASILQTAAMLGPGALYSEWLETRPRVGQLTG